MTKITKQYVEQLFIDATLECSLEEGSSHACLSDDLAYAYLKQCEVMEELTAEINDIMSSVTSNEMTDWVYHRIRKIFKAAGEV